MNEELSKAFREAGKKILNPSELPRGLLESYYYNVWSYMRAFSGYEKTFEEYKAEQGIVIV